MPPEIMIVAQREQVVPGGQVHIGIVTGHTLAAYQLVELIKVNHDTVPVILADGARSATDLPPNVRVVIVIDLYGLPLPTSEYLEAFAVAIPGCAFLALDRPRNEIDVAQLLRAGFDGFISHNEALYLLGQAISAVAKGDVWTSPGVIRTYMNLTSRRRITPGASHEMLTVRESQILELLRRRYSNKEMATFLRISESTVKFHVSNVLMKLNASNRRDLTDHELFQVRV